MTAALRSFLSAVVVASALALVATLPVAAKPRRKAPLPRPAPPTAALQVAQTDAQEDPQAQSPARVAQDSGWLWWTAGSVPRRLRGDFEPIDVLLLVYEPHWEDALRVLIERAAGHVDVELLMTDELPEARAMAEFATDHCARVSAVSTDTPWIRDYGPMQCFEGQHGLWLDYAYDPERAFDDAMPTELGAAYRVPVVDDKRILDGGAVVSNGQGLCAITERSFYESGVTVDEGGELDRFARRLGCRGLAVVPALPDEQTGHADVTIQFVARDRAIVASMDPDRWPLESALLDRSAELITHIAAQLEQPLTVVRVPMIARGDVFFSYVNGTRVDSLFFVPEFSEVSALLRAEAHRKLQEAMPGVELVAVPADAMVDLGGAVHCITLGVNLPKRTHAHARRACRPPPRG